MSTHSEPIALLFTSGHAPAAGGALGAHRCLLPLLDKPLLQLATEALVRLGCRTFHVFVDEAPQAIRDLLGNGERWGIDLTYHYLDDQTDLAGNLRRLPLAEDRPYWLASAERMPLALAFDEAPPVPAGPVALHCGGRWSGWACVDRATLARQPRQADVTAALATPPDGLPLAAVDGLLDVGSDATFQASALALLAADRQRAGQPLRQARAVRIHPTAQLIGPVYLGPRARVGASAIVGPNVVVGEDCVIDAGAEIHDSIVLPATYVGRELLVQDAVAAPATLVSLRTGSTLTAVEPHLLASARPDPAVRQWRAQLPILLLQCLLWPLAGLARVRAGRLPVGKGLRLLKPARHPGGQEEILTLPLAGNRLNDGDTGPGGWVRHFAGTFYPGLTAVRRGQLALFGLEMRDVRDLASLPEDWRSLYHRHPAGLLNDALSHGSEAGEPVLRQASDLFAAAGLPAARRQRILAGYLANVLRDLVRLRRSTAGTPATDSVSHS